MGFTVESLREAMKYMVESQGFDRVLRKVRAGRGARAARPPGGPSAGGWPLTAAAASDWRGGRPLQGGLHA